MIEGCARSPILRAPLMMAFPVVDGIELVSSPPSGTVIDPTNPRRHGQAAVYIAFAVCTVVTSGFLAMRLYTSTHVAKRLGLEDRTFFEHGKSIRVAIRLISCFNVTDLVVASFVSLIHASA